MIAVSNGPNDPNFQIPLPQAVVLPGPAPPQPDWRPPVDVPDPHARDVEFSVTLSLSAGHVPPGWLDAFLLWMQAMCKAGLGALERGTREQHLHIQGTIRMRVSGPVDQKLCDRLKKQIKAACGITHGSGFRTRMELKPFGPGQTWGMMLAYCTKDVGKPHYRCVMHNVSQEEIDAGFRDWQSARLSYDEGRVQLTKKNLFDQLYAYRSSCPPDLAYRSFIETFTDMLNTGQYVVSPLAIMGYGIAMRAAAAEAFWALIYKQPMTMDMCSTLVFSDYWSQGARARPHERYYAGDYAGPAAAAADRTRAARSHSPSPPPSRPASPALSPLAARAARARGPPSGLLNTLLKNARAARGRVEDLGDFVRVADGAPGTSAEGASAARAPATSEGARRKRVLYSEDEGDDDDEDRGYTQPSRRAPRLVRGAATARSVTTQDCNLAGRACGAMDSKRARLPATARTLRAGILVCGGRGGRVGHGRRRRGRGRRRRGRRSGWLHCPGRRGVTGGSRQEREPWLKIACDKGNKRVTRLAPHPEGAPEGTGQLGRAGGGKRRAARRMRTFSLCFG